MKKINKKKSYTSPALIALSFMLLISTMFGVPNRAFALTTGFCAAQLTAISGTSTVRNVFQFSTCFIERMVVPVLVAIALAAFVWGVVKFMGEQNAEKRKEAKLFMVWGIVGFSILLSVWAFVTIIGTTLSIQNVIPTVQRPGSIH